MKKVLFLKTFTNAPFASRKKAKKGIIEYITPKKTSMLSVIPLTNVGDCLIKLLKKKYFQPKISLFKEFFIAGAHKYWLKMEMPNMNILFKRNFAFESAYTSIMYVTIEADGEEKEINLLFTELIENVKKDIIPRINFNDIKTIEKYQKENPEIVIENLHNPHHFKNK